MDRINTLKEKLKVSNDTTVDELAKLTGVSRMGLFRWNKSGNAPNTLRCFILGTRYRTVSNDTQKVSNDTLEEKIRQWKADNPKATFISMATINELIQGS